MHETILWNIYGLDIHKFSRVAQILAENYHQKKKLCKMEYNVWIKNVQSESNTIDKLVIFGVLFPTYIFPKLYLFIMDV